MRRILYIVGAVRPWAINHRAEQLAAKLAADYDVRIHSYRDLPDDLVPYEIIHLQTPMALRLFLKRADGATHNCWGFEIIATRSNRYIETLEAVRGASFCVAKNPRLVAYAKKHVDCPVEYIPNGVDERMFCRKVLRVGWCGNHRPDALEYKGVKLIEQAVEILRREWRGAIEVEFRLDPGNAPKKILSQQEIAAWYRTLDVYVQASEGEGCSNTVLEALASGVPVVSTDVGITRELAEGCDLRIVERSVEAIAAGLRDVLEPIVNRRRLMLEEYTWKLVAEKYRKLYERLLAK